MKNRNSNIFDTKIVSLRNVQSILVQNADILELNAIPTLSAQTLDLCANDDPGISDQVQLLAALRSIKVSNPNVYLIGMLLAFTGARISEVLALKGTAITRDGRVHLTASKHGNDRIVRVPELIDHLRIHAGNSYAIFAGISRFHVYRQFRKLGIGAKFGDNKKRSVTHLFRHLVGIDLFTANNDLAIVKDGLGQKTETAAEVYTAKTPDRD